MKRTIFIATSILVAVLLIFTQTGFAASDFSLKSGKLTQTNENYALLNDFFQKIKIVAIAKQNKYILSGKISVKSEKTYEKSGAVGNDVANGEINGEYYPETGFFYGTLNYKQEFIGKIDNSYGEKGEYTSFIFLMEGRFSGNVESGDRKVPLKFIGQTTTRNGSELVKNDFKLNVSFDIEGVLPFTQKKSADDKLEDSGIRFSGIGGEVEVLLPTGYDADGEPIFEDEEGWNWAKLDMELPYGTKLRLKDRSYILLSTPTTGHFEYATGENTPHGETTILLPLKKNDSVWKLLAGNLYHNVKKMILDGTMDIEMGQAVTSIKGTIFILEEDGKTSKIKVLEGEVGFKSKVNQDLQLIKAGEAIEANASGLSQKTTFDVKAEEEKWKFVDDLRQESKKRSDKFNINLVGKIILGPVLIGGLIFVYFLLKKKFDKKENR